MYINKAAILFNIINLINFDLILFIILSISILLLKLLLFVSLTATRSTVVGSRLSRIGPADEAAPTPVPAHDHHVHDPARKSEKCNCWGESEYQEKKTKPLATKMIQTFELGIVSMVHFSSLTLLSLFLLFLTSTTIFLNSKKKRRNNQKHCRTLHFPSKFARFITLNSSL